ncbi:MAG: 3-oxoacyl-[acyl-carrier-protein] synthase-1 [Paracoccaceae bacterium]|jgi:3-oxoacyl-[acyl-carrier-protein] synthase-1
MNKNGATYLPALGVVSALGRGKDEIRRNLFAGERPGVVERTDLLVGGTPVFVGEVPGTLPEIPDDLAVYASRNLKLMIAAADEIRNDIEDAISRYGRDRIAVVMGTSTSGIAEGESAIEHALAEGQLPPDFDMRKQELGSTGEALARYLGLAGPALTVSTACSSGAHALAMGRRFIQSGLVDAVVAGGADSLCRLTVNGFHALSAHTAGICNPFSRNRDGTMIGEGAALFLMEDREAEIGLYGSGASTDAHSMTAPEPDGIGVEHAIRQALSEGHLTVDAIDYVHLHGTGTLHNDPVESNVVTRLFGPNIPSSSSKGQLGHTLGAAGAMGAAHCWLAGHSSNTDRHLPPHVWDGVAEPGLLSDALVSVGTRLADDARGMFLSNAIAFGGNNVALVLGRAA